jgi:1,4-alpha-glucan branching enzyme
LSTWRDLGAFSCSSSYLLSSVVLSFISFPKQNNQSMFSSIEFRLFAPRIERALLTGSFNSWQDIEMSKDNRTGEFSTKFDLEDGEYTYKFRILSRNEPNKIIDIIDPCATRIEDDEKSAILKVNKGKKVNGNEYIWKYDGKNLPENRDLIIYEIFLADFTEEGKYAGNK